MLFVVRVVRLTRGVAVSLKKELINRRSWPAKAEMRTEVFDYIEVFYNRERRHSTLGQRSPADYEKINHPTAFEEQAA